MPRGNASISSGKDKLSHTEKLTSYIIFLKEEKAAILKRRGKGQRHPKVSSGNL